MSRTADAADIVELSARASMGIRALVSVASGPGCNAVPPTTRASVISTELPQFVAIAARAPTHSRATLPTGSGTVSHVSIGTHLESSCGGT